MPTAHDIIREALARACYDADQSLFDDFARTALDGRPKPQDPARRLADRVVAEMTRDGYKLISARYWKPTDGAIACRMMLEDIVTDGISSTARVHREALGSTSRATAGSARAAMTEKIVQHMHFMRVVLRRRRRAD